MNLRQFTSTTGSRTAVGALATGAVLALWTLVRAIRLDAVPDAPAVEFAIAEALGTSPTPAFVDVRSAVERDPFSPGRTAPPQRYRIPGENGPDVVVEHIEPPKPVVLGTALSDPEHSFATCTLDGGAPSIVHVGEKLGEYTVKFIDRGHVVFTTASGKKLDIPALKPGSSP
ncbi:MAG TPA: hypothetical protein VHE78_16050 [Gemmatimonadaceae bacterium]|nr:hypothetical protein [Gemmatimonadaceae bacterium]